MIVLNYCFVWKAFTKLKKLAETTTYLKVRSNNRWEIQIDTHSGEVTQVAYRRSDLIEQIHDGSWFHDKVKLWIFLPSGIILFVLWITGFYMFLLPYIVNWRKN